MNENQNEYVDINAHDNYPDSEQKIEIPTMKVIPLKKICMTIGALPTSYLDTLSYYEMLVWFIEFLKNNIIPTINNNASAIQEVQSVVLALQEYINNYKDSIDSDVEELEEYMNNYFENLDVQEEINNKLDQMLEDGVLEQIIEQFIQSTAIWCFDSVGDMKLATNLIDGSYTKTLGYYSVNDGGSATYKIRQITNDDVIDEMFLLSLNNENLVAELIINEYFVIDMIGAKGDGTNDDSNYFEAAMSKVKKINGNLNKTYLADIEISTSNFTLNNINLKGMITFDENLRFINITNCNINATGKNYGIYTDYNVTKLVIDNCYIHDALNTGLYLNRCWDCQINKISLSSNAVMGAYLKAFNSSVFNGTCYFNGTGMKIEDSSACNIRATIQENKKTGIDVRAITGSKFHLYLEQNGYLGEDDFEKTQCYLGAENQANVGNDFVIYAIGGSGSEMESKYGLYSQWSYECSFTGCFYNHTDTGARFTSNNTNISCNIYDNTHVNYGNDNILAKHAYFKQIQSNTVFDIPETDDCIPVIVSDTAYMVSFNRRSSTQGLIRVTDKDGVNQSVTCYCYILKNGIRT